MGFFSMQPNYYCLTDEEIDSFFPLKIRKFSDSQWTPLSVAKKAIEFLVTREGTKVLDLGSGAGKFCVVAAKFSRGEIYGVEMRENLVLLSRKLANKYNLMNVTIIHADIEKVTFSDYKSFYFFNSFEENINLTDKLNKDNSINEEKYEQYIRFLNHQLDKLSIGTRIVTYCGEGREIPESYLLFKSSNKGKLKFWEKRY